ncbi:hypothetical protein [Christiangramia salexigens]|uniref:Uncharacterized protein n=1 Tax=Christiangramia salexigens TaxID=1913577 RepID=A0A1L3J455_9FLAO|nr:hypothetical protein [Christiangramia salexigens]APG59890.1 hypothetical protein LPB144_05445 [Christiangramia salexigens]
MKKLILLSFVVLAFTSCSKEMEDEFIDQSSKVLDLVASNPGIVEHSFGGAGYVKVSNDGTNFYVEFIANSGHKLLNSRLDIVSQPSDFATNGGNNLPPGQMGNVHHTGGGVSSYTYEFLMSDYADCVYIAPWAIFSGGGNDTRHYAGDILGGKDDKNNAWSYFKYGECSIDDEVVACNSTYMLSAPATTLNTFYREKPSTSNWGWYQYYNNAPTSSQTFDVWTGAGGNDTSKGFRAGTVTIAVNEGVVTATPNWIHGGFSNEIHLNVSETMPAKRPAPGKFVNSGDTNKDGKFVVIFHSRTCWINLVPRS